MTSWQHWYSTVDSEMGFNLLILVASFRNYAILNSETIGFECRGEGAKRMDSTLLSKTLADRIKQIKADSQFQVLTQLDEPSSNEPRITQYVAYTDFSAMTDKPRVASIYVFTPYMNLDAHQHPIVEYQTQLMFHFDPWQKTIHVSVLETLGSASKLAFFDYQNHGLATVALKALIGVAKKNGFASINGVISSFDGHDDLVRISNVLRNAGFQVQAEDDMPHVGEFHYEVNA